MTMKCYTDALALTTGIGHAVGNLQSQDYNITLLTIQEASHLIYVLATPHLEVG